MKTAAHKMSQFKDSIFGVISQLARENQAVNLGQGFPDFDGAQWLKDIVNQKVQEGHGQYAPFMGSLHLREEISSYYKRFYSLAYDPHQEITITVGATEALYSTLTALLDRDDEVIVLEPFYDSYVASIQLSGAKAVPVTMHAPDFTVDPSELEKAVTNKTKILIINNPHNPTGKVWAREELQQLAHFALKHDLLVISDEVYEFLLFDGATHIPMATLDGMKERTLTISSAGKTFGLTGWKIGWVCAPEHLSRALRLVHQYVAFSVSTPMQEAVAEGLKRLEGYVPGFQAQYKEKRDYFYAGMKKLGFTFAVPKGTYFMMVPIANKTTKRDVDYAMELIKNKKVATVPPSSFYLKSKEGEGYLRFCFAKKQETLESALSNLERL